MSTPTSFKEQILSLAGQHGVVSKATATDHMAQDITRLAGDDVEQDEVELTLVHLAQNGHVTVKQSQDLLLGYLDERGE